MVVIGEPWSILWNHIFKWNYRCITGWCFGTWICHFPIYCEESSQLTFTPSFFRGVGRYTTNQIFIFIYILFNSLSDHEPNWVSTGVTYVSAGSPDSEGPAADPHPHSPLQFTRQDFHAEQCELQIPGVVWQSPEMSSINGVYGLPMLNNPEIWLYVWWINIYRCTYVYVYIDRNIYIER